MEKEKVIKQVIDAAYAVSRELSPGYLESVYQNALVEELSRRGMKVDKELPLQVFYKGVVVGEFRLDVLVDGWLIVELKAVSSLSTAHEVQLVNYLNATKQDIGLVINFGTYPIEIHRKYRVYKKNKDKEY